jgi:hypothetical protein
MKRFKNLKKKQSAQLVMLHKSERGERKMIKALIRQHLNELIEAKEKKIEASRYEKIYPHLRDRISLIQNPMDIDSQAWNVILDSSILLDFINKNKTVSGEVIEKLTMANRKKEEIEKAIECEKLNEIYEVVNKVFQKYREGYYYYGSYHRLNFSDVFLDVVLYSLAHGFTPERAENATKAIITIYNKNQYKQYKELGNERIAYLAFVQLPYAQEIFDKIGHFKEQKENLDFFQMVYEKINDKDVFQLLYNPIEKALKQSKDPENTKAMIQKIFMHSRAVDWLQQLCPTSEDILLDREIRQLAQADTDEENAYAIIYGEDSPQCRIFNMIGNSYSFDYLRTFVKDCMMNKKKAFIRLISENIDTYKMMDNSCVLFNKKFTDIVNINTLNAKDLQSLSKMYDRIQLKKLREDVPLTFKEFEFLYHQKEQIDIDLFYELMDLSIDQRLRICRELPSLKPLLDVFEYQELIQKVARLVRVKPMKKWLSDYNLKVKDATDVQYLFMLLSPEKIERFKNEIQTGADIDFIIKNHALLEYADTLERAKSIYISEDEDCKFMLEDIGVSKEFIQANKSNIVSFCERGLAHVYATIHRHGKMSSEQLKNLRLITKAELAGKLEEIKFVDEDFELEIGLAVSEKAKSEWKHNRSLKAGDFSVEETYDYETTIRIGEIPVRSCLNWDNGAYSRCLLSHFDTNKKILIAKDKKRRISARASLRLTKGSEEYIELGNEFKAKTLSFKDIDSDAKPVEEPMKEVKEELVLFLERCYTSLDDSQAEVVKSHFIQLAQEKANELGAKLVVADDYRYEIPYDSDLVLQDYYIFISYSKNGYQYLDSLSGQATESNEGNYRSAKVFVQRSQVNEHKA